MILPNSSGICLYDWKINKGLHDFSNQIISEGTMLISYSGLADLKLSATSGMSGSPILVKIENNFKCIGIYCGRSPIEGQYLLMKVLDSLINGNYREALSLFEELPFNKSEPFLPSFEFCNLKIKFYRFMILSNILEQEKFETEHPRDYEQFVMHIATFEKSSSLDRELCDIQHLIKKVLIGGMNLYIVKGEFSYNAGILINTEAFKILRRVVDIFKNIERTLMM